MFFYPPPALFLLAPLGWTDIRIACQAWQWLNLGFSVLNVWLLVRFANSLEPRGANWIVGLLLRTLRGTAKTFVFTQVNFILLAALLLYWQFRDRGMGGAALAAGILTKPFLAFAPLEMILAGRLRAMAGGLATGLVWWEQAFIGFALLWLAFALITPPTNSLAPGEK